MLIINNTIVLIYKNIFDIIFNKKFGYLINEKQISLFDTSSKYVITH